MLNKGGLEFKDAADNDGNRASLGIYTQNSVQYNNADVFQFDEDTLRIVKKVTSTTTIPKDSNELVTKAYVDGVANGLNVIKSCDVATNGNVEIEHALKSGKELNGLILESGMRVLVWKQDVLRTNGIYVVDEQNSPARSSDFDEPREIKGGVHTFVTRGNNFADCGFVVTTPDNELVTVGTSNIEWAQFSKSGVHQFAEGLKTADDGFTISVNEAIARTKDLNYEVSRATGAEATLTTKIEDEQKRATGAETALADDLDKESDRAQDAETTLADNLAKESVRVGNVETTLTTKIEDEQKRATGAETALADDLDKESDRAQEEEKILADNLAKESDRAKLAETNLDGRLENEVARAKAAEKTLNAELVSEVSRAKDAEAVLTDNLAIEVSRAKLAEAVLTDNLAIEIIRAKDAETTLTDNLAIEVSRAKLAETILDGKLENEVARANVAETALADKLDPSLKESNAMVFSNSNGTALTSYSGFYYDSSGITVPNVTTTSDETKKRDIKELSDSDLIYKLRPVEYKWKDENMDQRTKYGFIAQEVLEIFPSMVTKQNGVYGIEYINLISHLVKEVQILRELNMDL